MAEHTYSKCTLCHAPQAKWKCSRCLITSYCSKNCQLKDVPRHEKTCKPVVITCSRSHKQKAARSPVGTTEVAGSFTEQAYENEAFRRVLQTNRFSQYVAMALEPEENVGEEIHDNTDQQFVIVDGIALVKRNDEFQLFAHGDVFSVPAGTSHDVINRSVSTKLKVITVYTPPLHKPGAVHRTKEEGDRAEKNLQSPPPSALAASS